MLESIATAFPKHAFPKRALATPCSCDECLELGRSLKAFSCGAVPDSVLQQHYTGLPLLSAKAIACYLGSYLSLAYRQANVDAEVCEHVLYWLSPSDDGRKHTLEQGKFLTHQQIQVLRLYVEKAHGFQGVDHVERNTFRKANSFLDALQDQQKGNHAKPP